MTSDLLLFVQPRRSATAKSGGTVRTRRAAAAAIGAAENLREAIFGFIAGQGRKGATDQEVSEALGLAENTMRPRRCQLADAGHSAVRGERLGQISA